MIISVAILYAINKFAIKPNVVGVAFKFFNGHFNDLLAPVMLLAWSNILLAPINKRVTGIILICGFAFIVGLIWEFVTPIYKPSVTSDWWDVLCYVIGGMVYWGINKIKEHNESQKAKKRNKKT